jgi:phosphoribosylanthranilate isomerase
VKICGVRTLADARAAADAGADYIGLNFHPASPRRVDPAVARDIVAALPGVTFVGVFVDLARDTVRAIARDVGLQALQFHGDESPDDCAGWPYVTIKALRVQPGEDPTPRAARYATDHLLLDAFVPGTPGGTGTPLDLADITRLARLGDLPRERLFVAGGLTPERVAGVVAAVRPFAVDVASGVERTPGVKDHGKIEEFIRRAKAA